MFVLNTCLCLCKITNGMQYYSTTGNLSIDYSMQPSIPTHSLDMISESSTSYPDKESQPQKATHSDHSYGNRNADQDDDSDGKFSHIVLNGEYWFLSLL